MRTCRILFTDVDLTLVELVLMLLLLIRMLLQLHIHTQYTTVCVYVPDDAHHNGAKVLQSAKFCRVSLSLSLCAARAPRRLPAATVGALDKATERCSPS